MNQRLGSPARATQAKLIAVAIGAMFGGLPSQGAPRKARKPAPMMVTASPAEIAAWNAKVDAKRRVPLLTKQERRAIVRAIGIRQHKKDIRTNRLAEAA